MVIARDKTFKPAYLAAPLIAVVIVGGIWAALSAAYENVRFAQNSDRLLTLVTSVRDLNRERAILFVNEPDALKILAREQHAADIVATNNPATIINPWKRFITARMTGTNLLRVETDVPTHVCRRLLDFFAKDIVGLGLVQVEAKDDQNRTWRQIFDAGDQRKNTFLSSASIQAGCGDSDTASVALVFALR